MNDLKVFEGKEVEVIEVNGVILFNPRHVAACLDLSESTIRSHLADMDETYVRKLTSSDVQILDIRNLNNAGENFLTEAGLYKLIFKSQKPEAERFQKWVTSEVLPIIRKTGSYTTTLASQDQFTTPIRSTDVFKAYYDLLTHIGITKNAAIISANQATVKIAGQNILQTANQSHLLSETQEIYYTPTELGKEIDKSAKAFNLLLEANDLQERIQDHWQPTTRGKLYCIILDTGKKHSSGIPIQQIKWSQKVLKELELHSKKQENE